ncbi:Vacuolar protein sorting-associated protein 13, DH-like domain [Dillenia turbinata]|uniref:Vacuolar protein sorting-associated protein 13, DH-like domain n=1 Tax=Dillenia turbinata TaxID=194707 RepID=A0AAN8ZCY1_9MAGN
MLFINRKTDRTILLIPIGEVKDLSDFSSSTSCLKHMFDDLKYKYFFGILRQRRCITNMVLHLLRKYLGDYVHGLSLEALRISVWKGDVVLRDLKLKAEALNSLKLPVTVTAGFVGTITLKVPWKSLGKDPVIVAIDRVFILAHPAPDGRTLEEEDREKLFEAKLRQIEEAESATLEAISRSKQGNPAVGNSWLSSLIATVLGNLKVSISNVHIRYEDSASNPGHPFSVGFTLAKLAAFTMDEQGKETFDTSGALDKLRKLLQLERLAMYHDFDSNPWKINKEWADLTPKEWVEIFEDGINESTISNGKVSQWALGRNYLVAPINGVLKYNRLGKQERSDPEIPFEKASLFLSDISITMTEAQYRDWIKILEVISRYKTYVEVSHLRPVVPISEGRHLWWRYAAQAGLQQKKIYRFSWDQIQHLCQLRRRYVQLYAGSLQQLPNINNSEIRDIEKNLDSKVILLWRLLAHAKVESVKSKEAAEQRRHKNNSWWSFKWLHNPSEDEPVGDVRSKPTEETLSKEEWQAINNLLSCQPDEELALLSGKDMQNMIRFLVEVSIGQAAARVINMNHTEVLCGRFEQLHVSTKLKHRSIHCDLTLKMYGLSAPEGSIAQSICSEQKVNALAASFVHAPTGENLDWRLSATISPCHVTLLMESYGRFLEFVKRSNAVSPTVALETATALQTRIEKVTRRAQEQFQMVLEEQSRFALDIDLDAPKVRIPLRTSASKCDGHFLLDFGHFTLQTKDGLLEDQGQSLYSRFYISGRDIAAFFTDCCSEGQNCALIAQNHSGEVSMVPLLEDSDKFSYLVDRCGMAVIVDQIKVPHPGHPSTRISVQVPTVGIHFSPLRYGKLMTLLRILSGTVEVDGESAVENFQAQLAPWCPADLTCEARILVWTGIGNSVAAWQPCFLVLSGLYLYVLESEVSQSYQRCSSMAGRQVYEVPPTSVGGSPFCVAVSFRGMDIQKALESSSTLVIEFRDEIDKASWLKGLIQATYQASALPSVNVLGESSKDVAALPETGPRNLKTADLVINGVLVETKLLIYGKTTEIMDEKFEETLILEVLGSGGKIHLVCWGSDLTAKMKLHSLKIKDVLQGLQSREPQYLACSVLMNESSPSFASPVELHGKDRCLVSSEEDDIFKDALPDFSSFTDTIAYSQNMDVTNCVLAGDVVSSALVEPLNHDKDLGKEKVICSEIFYEAQGGDHSDFVSVTFSMRGPDSPDYDGTDTQMSIRMSKLEFFCNRPTLVALIGFGLDVSYAYSGISSQSLTKGVDEASVLNKEKADENERSLVKGLLGYGKGRAVFYLNMNVGSVTVFLNKEDGSKFAMFVQENFLLDLKVHPSSISIEGTLGNLRLCDMSLGINHPWSWLCDTRNQGVESLVKFAFNSYSSEDDDYEGYDYSLSGQLSAVRIVFLYRFVQEITMYFMELATPHTEEAIKLVDKVGGFEWLIQKYEMDGALALKLDLSLDTPLIMVPKNSMSKDFMQLDLGQLRVTNQFSWHGSPENDPSAVHLDVLHAEILGINMAVGIDGCLGIPMIREGKGLDVYVRRSLRDVFRKVPTFSLEVKVGILHGVMSNKEYNVILNCLYMNLNELPNLPPSFRGGKSGSEETMRLLVDKVNANGQMLLSRTINIIAVEVNYALLELCSGINGDSPLACIALEGLWVSYRMTSFLETDLYVTIPKFSIIDIRPDTKPEMRLMLGSSSDVGKHNFSGNDPSMYSIGGHIVSNSETDLQMDIPSSTMFLMDYRCRKSSQSFVVRLQQPLILVVPDFLLAVGEFFVPSLGAITGREESMDPKNDPIHKNKFIVLSSPVYKQSEDVVHLSPNRQLIADALGVEEYIYDGCGKTICLSEGLDGKDIHSAKLRPMIIIGRGKRLQFINVKIENGSLLRKYTYLSNNSSCSVSSEDGVEILSLDNFSNHADKENLDYMVEATEVIDDSAEADDDLKALRSFTFEAQVVHPEFTFYDGTKCSLDDYLHGEKLLRAKMDMSFMYASKESDTWIRALVKDLTIEAGSGIVVLDPVDISGGYTSVKDKTNMSILSTDIHFHLSLGVISLVLNLQHQASAALQFGNGNPLAPCISFDRLWVSHKENGPCSNVTFWRPKAPSNYVILGDCVTSRPIPPSQAIMAVSNTYGRVRKPVGFKLIGTFSDIQRQQDGECHVDIENDCSLWAPLAPPGYMALGRVAHTGKQPPPNHIVYCIRSDLVTSTTYLECIYSAATNLEFPGFSIWRLDNVLGSFYAHPSLSCPSKDYCCDLNHLLWNSARCHSSSEDSGTNLTVSHGVGQQTGDHISGASGWEILRYMTKPTNCFISTPHFEKIWWDKGSDIRRPVSIWRPISRSGFAIVGDCITEGLEPPALGMIFKASNPELSAKPVQFTKVAHIAGKGLDEVFFWFPIAPPGYVSLGCVATTTDEAPSVELLCCPRMDLISQARILESPISRSSSSKASHCWSIWKIENQACTFLARSDLKKPSSRLAHAIGDSVKPRAQENITAEIKIGCFSITVLDSMCGMMTPLFDTTIANIKLATHGRLDAMNAVLISSVAASTFNTQLEAWEPLVEPFDGIFKVETYDTSVRPPSRIAKRVRVAATSVLNVNVSAAGLETFTEAILSWRKQIEMEQKAAKLNEEAGTQHKQGDDSTFSALDDDDFQTVTIENKLGCDIYLKKVGQDSDNIELLHHDDCASIWVPPPRFSDRLSTANESRESRYYVAIQIYEAKGLPIIDDGNSHNFFCALRLLVDSQETDQQKLFPQSARTKCVKPLISKVGDLNKGTAKWNELFLFEVPRKGLAKLEVEVTNLAAKAGKGEVVGAFAIPVGHGANVLKKIASMQRLHQRYDTWNMVPYPLRKRDSNDDDRHDYGCLVVSTSNFERKTIDNYQRDMETEVGADRDIGFFVGLSPDDEWESFRSMLPLSVVPKSLKDTPIAMEVVMKNGKKHAILRGLATVINDSDVKLEFSICPVSVSPSNHNIVVEEVFENQRHHPISGWHNKGSTDQNHWSTRDFSYKSKDFFEPYLPHGWKWASAWSIDKSQFVDADGWAYGPDFQSLGWPPTSSNSSTKSAHDIVRRRRWIRTRQQEPGTNDIKSSSIGVIYPGSSAVLPWRCLSNESDWCLQLRPSADYSQVPYSWGHAVAIGSGDNCGKDEAPLDQASFSRLNSSKQGNKFSVSNLRLNQLEKKDILSCCYPQSDSKQFWISVGTDASVLHTDLNAPVYDWKISVNSPLTLENRLPSSAEFTIWEKTKEGKSIEREHGVISSRENVNLYSVDIRRPIYLTLFVQGGWILEKDPVLILDLLHNEHASSFCMLHRQSRRRLRVSIERDMGTTSAATKTIRFFVPYWIVNDSPLPLSYQLVEIEPTENASTDTLLLSRAVKSAISASKTNSLDRRSFGPKKNIQVLEIIEDESPMPSMLSPQDYMARSGLALFPSRGDAYLSPKVGISVAIHHSDTYSPGISLLELENKERIDVRAFASDGSYFKLSTLLNMTSDRTKVVHFQPHTLFVNRTGCSLCLRQCDTQLVEWIHPTDPPKPFGWQSCAKVELLKLQIDGYKWSSPFSVDTEGMMCVLLKSDSSTDHIYIKVEVRSGTRSSRYEVIFRPNSISSPYRIENRSMFLPIHFRQVGGYRDSWRMLLPNTAAAFLWEDLGRQRFLELLVDGTDPLKSEKYNIDEICDHQPTQLSGPARAIRVTVVKQEKMNVVKISDWMPENEPLAIMSRGGLSSTEPSENDPQHEQSILVTSSEFHFIVELAELGLSVIDHTPEEILYLSLQNLLLSYSTGLGSGISRFKLRMQGIQLDNQLPLTPMPVLFRPQKIGEETDFILKLSVTLQSNGTLDLCIYPYIGFHGPENSAFLINIHEPIIWRLHEMIQQINLSRIYDTKTTAVSVDPIIQIGVLNISEIRFKLSMAMSPTQRPRGVLGFWSSLMTALGNTENMPVRINQRFHENICMRQSSLISNAIANIRKDLLSQPLQLLSGVDILGNASSALGHMSKGVAALSMDKKFIQSRQRQESKGVEDLGDVIREGGGALAKGFFRGVTGILTKPLEGAKSSGVEGFVQGVGKGIIGVAAQPVSGVLDLLSKTTEGANAMRMKLASAITSEEQLLRRRLPRVIGGDNLLRPYDEYKAQGQVILQLAEGGSFFGQVDLFKVRGKFALSDAYEDHFLLPRGKILVVTHRRVILLQTPNIITQRKFSPARDPCTVSWDVLWDDLVTMELTICKKDPPNAPPSRLVLYLRTRSNDPKEQVRIIKCSHDSHQALEVYSAIEQAMNTYGPTQSKALLRNKMTKPYSPSADCASADKIPKDGWLQQDAAYLTGFSPHIRLSTLHSFKSESRADKQNIEKGYVGTILSVNH